MLMAWTGHASALLTSSLDQATQNDTGHAHAHTDGASGYAEYADHYHSSDVANHVHEIPNLPTMPFDFTMQSLRTTWAELSLSGPPIRRVFLIERPPCFLSCAEINNLR